MSLTIKVYAAVDINQVGDPSIGSSSFKLAADLDPVQVLKTGAGPGEVSEVYTAIRTLAPGASETLDLNGVLLDALGATVDFTNIKGIWVQADPDNTGNIVVGDAAMHAFQGNNSGAANTETLKPGAFKFDFDPAGWAVANGASDQLQVANTDEVNPANYTITIFG